MSSDNRSPSASRASLTIAWGILTARLFPHFDTCVSFGIWIYIEYTVSSVLRQADQVIVHGILESLFQFREDLP